MFASCRPLCLVVLALLGVLWPRNAVARIPIEQAQREFQARYFYKMGIYANWPGCSCNDMPPPNYPPDGFYGDDVEDPYVAAKLVDDLANKIFRNLGGPLSGYVDSEIDGFVSVDLPWIPPPPDMRPATPVNYPEQLSLLLEYLLSLTHLAVPAGWTGDGSHSDPRLLTSRLIDTSGPLPENASCADMKDVLLAHYEANPGQAGGLVPQSHAGVRMYELGGNPWVNWGYAVVSARAYADLSVYTNFPGSATCYIRVEEEGDGLGSSSPPGGGPDGAWRMLDDGSTPVPGEVFTSGVIPDEGGDPPVLSETCTGGRQGWSLHGVAVVIEPEFNTKPDFATSCDELCCPTCPNGSCDPARVKAELGSVRLRMGLGSGAHGQGGGFLYVSSDSLCAGLGSARALQAVAQGAEIIRDGAVLRQVNANRTFADVIATGPESFTVRFYHAADRGPMTNGLYTIASGVEPFSTVTVSNGVSPGGGRQFLIHESFAGAVTEYRYVQAFEGGEIAFTTSVGELQRKEAVDTEWTVPEQERTETYLIRDADDDVLLEQVEIYAVFPWGEELTRSTVDPDGRARTTSFAYYEDRAQDGGNYSQLKHRVDPDGRWERYSYDQYGRLTHTVSRFLDAPLDAPADQCRETRVAFGTYQGQTLVTTSEWLLGDEVSRTHRLYSPGSETIVRCTAPGVSPDTTNALVATTTKVNGGVMNGKPSRIEHADGTRTRYSYQLPSGGLRTMRVTGEASLDGQSVVQGRLIDTTVDDSGITLIAETREYPSYRILSRQETIDVDAFGRALRIDFLDGTSEWTTYSCCGPEVKTDREGIETAFVRDSLGRAVETQRAGIAFCSEYDGLGRVRRRVRRGSDGSELLQAETDYDLAGEVTEIRNGLGQATTFVSHQVGEHRIDTTTFPNGATEIREYFGDGSLYEVRGPAVAPVRYAYGVSNLVHDGQTIPTTYTRTLALTAAGEPTGTSITEYQDMLGRVIRTEHADGSAALNYYNQKGQLARSTTEAGVTTLYAYNATGELKDTAIDLNQNGRIDYDGVDPITRSTRTTRYAHGTDIVQTRQYVWTTLNDSNAIREVAMQETTVDGLASWQIVDGLTTHTTESFPGGGVRRSTVTTPDGVVSSTRHIDGLLAEVARTNRLGHQLSRLTYDYDPHGRLASVTDDAAGTTTYTYDVLDRVQTETLPPAHPHASGVVVTNRYDAMGQLTERHGPAGVVTNEYIPNGALRKRMGAHTYPVEYGYDDQGRPVSMTTWRGYEQDTGRAETRWIYDSVHGFLAAKHYVDGDEVTYTRDFDGRLTSRRWARNVTTDYAHDPAGRVTSVTFDDGTSPVLYGYDRLGRLVSVADAVGDRHFEYDEVGILTNEVFTTGPLAGYRIQRKLDALDRPSDLVLADANGDGIHQVGYRYDEASRLSAITQSVHTARYKYQPNSGRLSTTTVHNGSADVLKTTRIYDRLMRQTDFLTESLPGHAPLSRQIYSYNSAGLRDRLQESDGSYWDFTYDRLGQLASAVHRRQNGAPVGGQEFGYAYDDVGNRISSVANGHATSYVINDLNQYPGRVHPGIIDLIGSASTGSVITVNQRPVTAYGEYFHHQLAVNVTTSDVYATLNVAALRPGAGPNAEDVIAQSSGRRFVPRSPESPVYDADGNLLSDGRWTYIWNGANQLVAMQTRPDLQSDVPRQRLEFVYDFQGRRVGKKVYRQTASAEWTLALHRYFIYDGWNLLVELDALNSLAPIRTYTWGLDVSHTAQDAGGVGGLLAIHLHQAQRVETLYPVFNSRGDLIKAIHADSGEVVATFAYTPFGQLLRRSGSMAFQIPFAFSTKYRDAETDLLYFGYRYFNPTTARWISRDPAGESQGPNLYQFVANNPVSFLDPLGLALYAFDGTGTKHETWTHVSILRRSYMGTTFYADGVGSDWHSRFLGGAFGMGGRSRLESMYDNLVRAFNAGDREIDIIGFSRGASLAREFANMIYKRGVVEIKQEYRRAPGQSGRQLSVRHIILECNPTIRFVGLFDTVGSFGAPGNHVNIGIRMGLPPNVQNAAHAIASNERRAQFPLTPLNPAGDGQKFSERTFPGDHSDIGGGHKKNQNLLALAPLFYMHGQGNQAGVPFSPLSLVGYDEGLYLHVGGERRPWAYQWSGNPHDLTGVWYYTDGGKRPNLPSGN